MSDPNDIVYRLNLCHQIQFGDNPHCDGSIYTDALAEVERLRTELADVRAEKTRWETIAWDTKHELDSRKAQIDQYAAERDTLRHQLAVASALVANRKVEQ
jgi:hypothetical protein